MHVLELVAKRLHRFERAVAIGVADQEQRSAFLRRQDVALGVEGHRDQRAGLLVGHHPLDGELGIDHEPRAFVRDHDFVAPRQHAAERAVDFRREPGAIAELGGFPIRGFLDARAPGFVGREVFVRAAALLHDHADHDARWAGVGVRGLDRHHVDARSEQFRHVVHVHLPPIGAAAGRLAVDVQLVLVVARDVNLRELDLAAGHERLAEVAVADGHLVLLVGGRPDPIRADQLLELGLGLVVDFLRGLSLRSGAGDLLERCAQDGDWSSGDRPLRLLRRRRGPLTGPRRASRLGGRATGPNATSCKNC